MVYHLFPGVEVVYISVHMETFDFGLFEQGERNNYASIHFCREGRIEQKGIVESTKANTQTIASIFGKEAEVDAMFNDFQPRIDTLNTLLNGKDVLLGMYNSNALGLMDTESQLNIIAKELGANNLGETIGEVEKATHGEEASWETIITLDPEYMFILDRSTATGGIQAMDTMLADLEGALLNETF